MSYDKPISLSLQKEIKRRNLSLDSEIQGALKALRIKSMLARCNIVKQRGYATIVLLYWLLLLPFIMKRLTALWSDTAVSRIFDAKKDALLPLSQ